METDSQKRHRQIQLLAINDFLIATKLTALNSTLNKEPENQDVREKYLRILEYIDSFEEPVKTAIFEDGLQSSSPLDESAFFKVNEDLIKIGDFIKYDT